MEDGVRVVGSLGGGGCSVWLFVVFFIFLCSIWVYAVKKRLSKRVRTIRDIEVLMLNRFQSMPTELS